MYLSLLFRSGLCLVLVYIILIVFVCFLDILLFFLLLAVVVKLPPSHPYYQSLIMSASALLKQHLQDDIVDDTYHTPIVSHVKFGLWVPLIIHLQAGLALRELPAQRLPAFHLPLELPLQADILLPHVALFFYVLSPFLCICKHKHSNEIIFMVKSYGIGSHAQPWENQMRSTWQKACDRVRKF